MVLVRSRRIRRPSRRLLPLASTARMMLRCRSSSGSRGGAAPVWRSSATTAVPLGLTIAHRRSVVIAGGLAQFQGEKMGKGGGRTGEASRRRQPPDGTGEGRSWRRDVLLRLRRLIAELSGPPAVGPVPRQEAFTRCQGRLAHASFATCGLLEGLTRNSEGARSLADFLPVPIPAMQIFRLNSLVSRSKIPTFQCPWGLPPSLIGPSIVTLLGHWSLRGVSVFR